MPLNQLCTSSGNKRGSFSTNHPFLLASVHSEDVYDVKLKQPMERCDSQTSTLSFSRDICRICHCEEDDDMPLIAPCFCSGSLRFVHQTCLQQWIKSSDTKSCELCKFLFIMHSKVKPLRKWECLDMSGMERRKVFCSVAFHVIAITCVVWSLFVLIQRTSQEVQNGELEWPFWTKLIVVAIGFTGSIVFMYVQCKMYLHLCRRWRAFNRIIYVQNAPEKIPLSESDKSHLSSKEVIGRSSSEVEKPFLGVAVITTSDHSLLTTSTNSTSAAACVCTTPSPPGAIWADDLAQPPTSFPYFSSGVPNRCRGPLETENLIPSDKTVAPSYGGRKNSEKTPRKSSLKLGTSELGVRTKSAPLECGRDETPTLRVIHTQFRNGADEPSDVETLHLDAT